MDVDKVFCLVVGAGAVGLAIARELAQAGHQVIVAEQEDSFEIGVSSRSSEVIHSGIYYPEGSSKAFHCGQGRKLLYRFCKQRNIPFQKLGELILATTDEEVASLDRIRSRAHNNEVTNVDWADVQAVKREQPGLSALAALRSPSTGILNSQFFMEALRNDAQNAGAIIAYRTHISEVQVNDIGFEIAIAGEDGWRVHATNLVNSAGLGAIPLAKQIRQLNSRHIPTGYLAKGNYFSLAEKAPFTTLIYPVPPKGGLGIHLTLDMGGRARFGPDVEWVDRADYSVNCERMELFYRSIRRYWPDLPDNSLFPEYAGIRPKIHGPDTPAADFRIDGPERHGISGLVNLFGIESPGLTASLSIATEVAAKLSVD